LLGFDSVARIDWPKLLPKSTETLRNLETVFLNGFNIVGDGTPASLIPLLTSQMEHELPNTMRNTLNSDYVDRVYPFLWSNFSDILGYETLFGEDFPEIGTFQYKMKGMSKPPVNHYMRYKILFIDFIYYGKKSKDKINDFEGILKILNC